METVIFTVALITALGLLAWWRAPLIAWSVVVLGFVAWLSYPLSPLLQGVIGLLLIPPLLLLNLPFLRKRFISGSVLRLLKNLLPHMSQTERDALQAGTVGWDAELFSGRPNWRSLLAKPAPKLSDEEQAFLDGPVEELCRRIDEWEITELEHDLPPTLWRFIKQHGFFGMIIPKAYGGLGFSALAHSAVVSKIAGRSITAAVTVMVPNSLGPAELLLHYGTEEQKDYYLPRLASGDEVPCFALTSPDAGSDAAAMQDYGVVVRERYQGKETLGIRLNWDKRYITLGPVATVLGLAFKLYDPEHLLGGAEEYGITCALIPTNTPGVTIGRRHDPLNQTFQNGPNQGKNVFIPMEWLIGGPAQAGNGWRMLMESLAAGRSISLPALSAGAGKLVSRAVGAYSRIRTQFNTPIGYFEGVEEALARIAGNSYAMDAARVMTCGFIDAGERPSVISAMIKYHLTERMRQVVNDGMDVLGGRGIILGPKNFLGRVYQALPISITVEGANILTRSLIIFGQGALRCHPWLFKEIEAAGNSNTKAAVDAFDSAFRGHVSHLLSNLVRAPLLALTGGRLAYAPAGPTRRYFQQLNRLSSAFAFSAELALLALGGSLKRKERLSARLGDIHSQLYLASAALKRFEDQGRKAEDLPLLRWAMEDALSRAGEALEGLWRNFPVRPVAWLLRGLLMPFGNPWRGPSDHLGHEVTRLLLAPSATRDRLTEGMFIPSKKSEPLAQLEYALQKSIDSTPLEKRLHSAIRDGLITAAEEGEQLREAVVKSVLNQHEASQLRQARQAREKAIAVDDFSHEYWKKEHRHGNETAA